jgi:hypothetical protein
MEVTGNFNVRAQGMEHLVRSGDFYHGLLPASWYHFPDFPNFLVSWPFKGDGGTGELR